MTVLSQCMAAGGYDAHYQCMGFEGKKTPCYTWLRCRCIEIEVATGDRQTWQN